METTIKMTISIDNDIYSRGNKELKKAICRGVYRELDNKHIATPDQVRINFE